MLRYVPEPYSGRTVGLKDSLVAEQDRDCDCNKNGEQPVLRSCFAMSLEEASDWMRF